MGQEKLKKTTENMPGARKNNDSPQLVIINLEARNAFFPQLEYSHSFQTNQKKAGVHQHNAANFLALLNASYINNVDKLTSAASCLSSPGEGFSA